MCFKQNVESDLFCVGRNKIPSLTVLSGCKLGADFKRYQAVPCTQRYSVEMIGVWWGCILTYPGCTIEPCINTLKVNCKYPAWTENDFIHSTKQHRLAAWFSVENWLLLALNYGWLEWYLSHAAQNFIVLCTSQERNFQNSEDVKEKNWTVFKLGWPARSSLFQEKGRAKSTP